MPDAAAPLPGETTHDGLPPRPADDGLVQLRRRSDWTGEPRAEDDASWAAYDAALRVATATLAAYDGGTASHSDDVLTLCLAMAEELGIHDRDRAYLLAAAELHDIGKVGVPPEILSKPAPLDPDEWNVVRLHTVTGERILGAVPELAEVARIVRHSHERWDGGGYPDGLAGEQIPLASRVVFCADSFHAIRGDRPYRRGRSAVAALGEVRANSDTQFDPQVVEALTTVAQRTRERRRSMPTVLMGGGRSQRLVALLAALTIGGSAFAAIGVWRPLGGGAAGPGSAQAADDPVPCTPTSCLPAKLGALGALPAAERAAGAAARATHRPVKRRLAPTAVVEATPVTIAPTASALFSATPTPRRRRASGAPRRRAGPPTTPPAQSAPAPAQPPQSVTVPPEPVGDDGSGDVRRGHGYGRGHGRGGLHIGRQGL